MTDKLNNDDGLVEQVAMKLPSIYDNGLMESLDTNLAKQLITLVRSHPLPENDKLYQGYLEFLDKAMKD